MSKLNDAKDASVTRREFLSRSAALGAASALPASLLSESTLAAAPKKGGKLRIAITESGKYLEPQWVVSSNVTSYLCRNNLVEIDADGKPIPELAESWEPSGNAKKWVFELRKGVEFHNGKSLDANDVVSSIKHHGSKSGAKAIVAQIKKVRADGKHTVVFELKKGNADFAFLMSDFHFVIGPAGTKGKAWHKGIGTGAYILREWKPGGGTSATRNPNYWKEGRGHFDEVELLVIPDRKARSNALRAGQIDVNPGPDLSTVGLLERTPNVQIVDVPSTFHFSLPMRTDQKPFDDNDVRLAVKHAIDREALVKTLAHGYAVPGNDHPIARSDRYHADELAQRQYDPDKAKFHLKKAGLSSLSVELSAANLVASNAVEMAVLYAEQAAKAGIKIDVVHERDKGYWNKVWKKKPWCMAYWAGRPTPDWMFTQAYASNAQWNDTFWKHKRFNQLLEGARAELAEAKRRDMYVEMQRIVSNEGGAVIPMFKNHVMAVSSKLAFGKVAANWHLDGLRLTERWWFA